MNLTLMIEEVTNSPKDWENFWNSPETYDEWTIDDFKKIWNEMEKIEPLTTEKESYAKSKYYYDYDRNDLNRINPFKK